MKKTIGFIGAGRMGGAIIKGLLSSESFEDFNVIASTASKESAKQKSQEFGIEVLTDNNKIAQKSDVIMLCVKPFYLKEVLDSIKNDINENQIIISIAAGISTKSMEKTIGKKVSVIRCMPNTPSLVNEGMSAICKGAFTKDEDLKLAQDIFEQVGKCIISQENLIDAITGVSGSGPAFFYQMIESLADGGVKLGLDKETAVQLSAQTALGAAKMILDIDKTPATLRGEVVTPGGTTEQGLLVLEKRNIQEILEETVAKTAQKAKELGR